MVNWTSGENKRSRKWGVTARAEKTEKPAWRRPEELVRPVNEKPTWKQPEQLVRPLGGLARSPDEKTAKQARLAQTLWKLGKPRK